MNILKWATKIFARLVYPSKIYFQAKLCSIKLDVSTSKFLKNSETLASLFFKSWIE